jgi:poly(hydroxyalkanoate) granule-associated protein
VEQVWLAGLGALALTEQEGMRFFRSLVKRGETVERRTRAQLQEAMAAAREVPATAMSRLESGMDQTMTSVLHRIGVPTQDDIASLTRRIEGLTSTLEDRAPRPRRAVDGDVAGAAAMLGRPPELDGVVVGGDQRGGTLGYPTANLRVDPDLLVPRYGIYAGWTLEHRAAISIGTNPHYGGGERRIEPFLLDFDGDLYGRRLVVELWQRLRDEAVFESEDALVEQIGRDVEATRRAVRPI